MNYLYKNKNKKTNKAHHNYQTMDERIIIQSTTAGKADSPKTTNCISARHQVSILTTNTDQNLMYYRCSFPCIKVHSLERKKYTHTHTHTHSHTQIYMHAHAITHTHTHADTRAHTHMWERGMFTHMQI